MLLGIDFFLSHRIYVSKRQRRMYLTYNGGPVFALSAGEAAKTGGAQAASAQDLPDADQPGDAAGFARRGAASAARRDCASALADLDQACATAPQVAEYFVQRGSIHQSMRQGKMALKDFDQALQLDPDQAEARLLRAGHRLAAKDREGTLEDLAVLDRVLPSQSHQRLQMAAMFQRLELPERAIAQWDQWVPAHPNDIELPRVMNNRCWLRAMLGRQLDEALEDCNRAIDLAPDKAG